MAIETSIPSIIIKDNVIDQGVASNGSSNTTYTYTTHLSTNGSAIINGNTFANPATSASMVFMNQCSGIITSNKFIRGSTSITSYISGTSTKDLIITDNIFDNSTVDGSSTTLVSGLTSTSIYRDNLNQNTPNLLVYKLASNYTNATGSLTNTNFTINIGASDTWFIEWDLICNSDTSATGIQFAVTGPTSAGMAAGGITGVGSDAATYTAIDFAATTLGTAETAVFAGHTLVGGKPIRIWAVIVGGGTAGAVTLQAKASSTNTVTISIGSIMRARLIDGAL